MLLWMIVVMSKYSKYNNFIKNKFIQMFKTFDCRLMS